MRDPLEREAITITKADLEKSLRLLEEQICQRYQLAVPEAERQAAIIAGIRSGEIPETNLVQSWLSDYGAYLRWDVTGA